MHPRIDSLKSVPVECKEDPKIRSSRSDISWMWYGLILVATVLPNLIFGQQGDWERHTRAGHQALSLSALPEAEAHYREALRLSQQFATEDLRRPTSMRNLAQTLVQQGQFLPADSLIRQAITTALITLAPNHAYVQSLRDELTRLQEAIVLSERDDTTPAGPRSLWQNIRYGVRWLSRNSVVHLGATLPLGGELAGTHDGGLDYGLSLQLPLLTLGPLPIELGIGYTSLGLPGIHAPTDPFSVAGAALTLEPNLGRLAFNLGLGVFDVAIGTVMETPLGLIAGVTMDIRRKSHRDERGGLNLAVQIRSITLLGTAPPKGTGQTNLIQLGIGLALPK